MCVSMALKPGLLAPSMYLNQLVEWSASVLDKLRLSSVQYALRISTWMLRGLENLSTR